MKPDYKRFLITEGLALVVIVGLFSYGGFNAGCWADPHASDCNQWSSTIAWVLVVIFGLVAVIGGLRLLWKVIRGDQNSET